MAECSSCFHNAYKDIDSVWVDCVHPVTVEKVPRWQFGDPEFVSHMTADMLAADADKLDDCACWEPV